MAHTRCMLDKQGYTQARACTRPRSRAPSHTHAHAHTGDYGILLVLPREDWLRERASSLRYTYIACLVKCRMLLREFMTIP